MQSLVILCAALFLGCGDEAAQAADVQAADVQSELSLPDTLVISADPELSARVSELLPSLAERAGLPLVRPVRVEWRSRSELEQYLRVQLDEEFPVSEADHVTRAYSLLGLVPESLDLRALLLEVYQEQVAGFYDPDSLALWVMDDQPDAMLQTVLLHELVHAVQDQAVSLDRITAKDLGSDRRVAAQAAIEGHATLVMLEELLERSQGQDVDVTTIPGLAETLVPSQELLEAQYPALADAPSVIRESLLFPYLAGAGFVLDLWTRSGQRPAPFGDFLPGSTEHILHPEVFAALPRDEPVSLVLESSTPALYDDELGELGVGVFLRDAAGAGIAAMSGGVADASGWAGDRFALYTTPEGDALVWVVVWDSPVHRDRFLGDVRRTPWMSTSGAVITAEEVDGHPGIRLTVGSAPDVAARSGS